MIQFIKKMFHGVDTQYLVKSYIISIAVSGFLLHMNEMSFTMTIYVVLAGFLFPFATIIWDDLIDTLMGGHSIIIPLLFMLMWKGFKILVLYTFSPLIAPFGMLYVYIANGYYRKG
ncbi:hypothetical protein HWX41_19305 [Bacillus paramycoides]|uniref:hypothetical protein n=1 Tax=Bacillus cereus group TaxID=86661 RepID=UPI0015B98539|nr:hypothetical protein [Bacillus paramycoides]NWK71164.1 hypothetical protein [Bacillus paramycoides]